MELCKMVKLKVLICSALRAQHVLSTYCFQNVGDWGYL